MSIYVYSWLWWNTLEICIVQPAIEYPFPIYDDARALKISFSVGSDSPSAILVKDIHFLHIGGDNESFDQQKYMYVSRRNKFKLQQLGDSTCKFAAWFWITDLRLRTHIISSRWYMETKSDPHMQPDMF